jgi:hypothetical protein
MPRSSNPEPQTPKPIFPVRMLFRRFGRLALDALAFGLTAVAVTGFIISLGRREIARDLLLLYFQGQGLEAEVEIDQLSVAGLSGRLRLGPAKQPTLQIDRFDVAFAANQGDAQSGPSFKIQSIRLLRPRLMVPFRDGHFDLRRIGPIVKALNPHSGSQQGGNSAPLLFIDGALITVQTDYGPIIARLSGSVGEGMPLRLSGRIVPFGLTGEGLLLTSEGGPVQLRASTGLAYLTADLAISELVNDQLGLEESQLRLDGAIPYTSGPYPAGSPTVHLVAGIRSGSISHGAWVAQGSELNLRFDGTLQPGTGGQYLHGDLALLGRADVVSSSEFDGRAFHLNLAGQGMDIAADRGLGLVGTLRGRLDFDKLAMGKAFLDRPRLQFQAAGLNLAKSDLAVSAKADVKLAISADRVIQGSLALVQPFGKAQMPSLIYRSQDGGRWPQSPWTGQLSAAQLRLETGGDARPAALGLAALQVRFTGMGQWGADGPQLDGMVSASARDDMDLSEARVLMGALAVKAGTPLATQSRDLEAGLSDFQLNLPSAAVTYQPSGIKISLTRPLELTSPSGARFELVGRAGGPTLTQDRDGNLSIRSRLSAALGADGRDLQLGLASDMLAKSDGSYRIVGHIDIPRLDLPSQKTGIRAVTGEMDLTGDGKTPLAADLSLAKGQLVDLAEQVRFEPLSLKGQANLAQGTWRAKLSATTQTGHALGKLSLRHSAALGQGEAVLEAKDLVFAQSGLQPRDLSPMIRAVSQANGRAEFTGRMDWTKMGLKSHGALGVTLDSAQTPMGGLRAGHLDIKFSSLLPLLTGPGQTIGAERLGLEPPLTNLNGLFSIGSDSVQLQVGAANWAGGRVWLEPSRLPLDGSKPLSGNLVLDGVDLGQILAASPMSGQVKISATMDGTLPFEIRNGVIRIGGGHMVARGPGRISIARTALTSLQAGTGRGTASATSGPSAPLGGNAIQDFAYQAMENLAFDSLDARIDSRPGARLGLVFHIKGRNDPEKDLPAKIALTDLVRGRAFDKPIPLPKGTPIDLTLDTSLNFDDLVKAAQQSFERRTKDETGTNSRSAPVQP